MKQSLGWCSLLALVLFVLASTARAESQRTPIVLIPGIVGSKLCEAGGSGQPGNQLWGAGLLYMGRIGQLKLPINPSEKEAPIAPCGLLENFAVLGPFEVDVYSGLVDFLEKQGYRKNETLFIFDYDWRRSNFETAEILRRRIDEIIAKTGQPKVHLIAHSMGGIVARIYLQALDGAKHVDGMVFLGTPHQGSVEVLKTANDGWGWLPNWVVGGEDVIRDTVLSWPSVYELIPLDICCRQRDAKGVQRPLSLSDAGNWARLGWLPQAYRSAAGRTFIQQRIAQSMKLRKVLQTKLPPGPFYEFIVSASYPTAQIALFDATLAKLERFLEMRGDEAVTLLSASNGDLRSARLVGARHATIFDDDLAHFYIASAINLDVPALAAKFAAPPSEPKRDLRFDTDSNPAAVCAGLTKEDLDPYNPGSVLAVLVGDDGKRTCIQSFRLETSTRAAPVGTGVTATLELGGYSGDFARTLSPTLRIVDDRGGVIAAGISPNSFTLTGADGRFRALYRFAFSMPKIAGVFRVDADQGGLRSDAATAVLIAYPSKPE